MSHATGPPPASKRAALTRHSSPATPPDGAKVIGDVEVPQPGTPGAVTATTQAGGSPADAEPARDQRLWPRLTQRALPQLFRRYSLLIALAILIALFSALRPSTFFTVGNLTTTLGIESAAALLAVGVTVVLLAGEFDLSLASIMGFSASVTAYLTTHHSVPIVVACLLVLAGSAVIGLVNALFIVRLGIHSFIVTLGMGTLVQGLAIGMVGATTIGGLPEGFTGAFQGQLFGIQYSFYYMLAIGVLFYLVLGRMPLGRSLFFTGNARTAAALAGIHTGRLRTLALVTAAVVAGACGIMLAGQTGAASPTIADPYLLPGYAAAFLGATAFTPGRFNIWGSLWAVYLLAVGTTGLQLLGLQSWVIDVFDGSVLVLAVAFSLIFETRRRRGTSGTP